ncbi:DUF4239 domain-containing protein [Bradyrhizobium sp. CB82]|uniref:bestrophin-like domain n=1 Tax=Bradyrhizobium sp. CB82 TaxID=3039159 RepID=UPI0024B2517F|nr:DUF4239 domain-containing protein [Bradyrhizobium sp. CB82]WFU41595.1 DUF4239 domain-containing protein [Bradyrhizobium sp. CB82]
MSDWLHNLPVPWMVLVIFGFTYFLAMTVFAAVMLFATEARTKSLKTISPGMLPVLGIIFGLFVAFTAAQVWGDSDRASAAVSREASALRSAVLLAAGMPAEQETRLRGLVRDYVGQAVALEWPMMARREASLKVTPPALAEALQLVVTMAPQNPGQATVQRELISALEQALDARRQRIIISLAAVNAVKWWCLYLQATCALLVIGLVHCDSRLAAAIAMSLFATGVAASVLLIAAHDRPFAGQISIGPGPLLQITPEQPDKP